MNIDIKATNVELTEKLGAYVEKKISSLQKYMTQQNEGAVFYVELAKTTRHHRTGEIFRAEVKISGGGMDTYASSESTDLYSAIDMVEGDLAQELKSEKGRKLSLTRRGQRAIKEVMKGFKSRFDKKI